DLLQIMAQSRGYDELIPDLERIRFAGDHLLALISDILDLSKIEAGKLDLFLETFSVEAVVLHVATAVRPLIEQNRNTLKVLCPEDIGSIHADLTRMQQVLFNLLSNAAKFTEKGVITLRASSECSVLSSDLPNSELRTQNSKLKTQNWIVFEVSDTGIGMTEE